jgi:DNA-binding response OmpR family regulator
MEAIEMELREKIALLEEENVQLRKALRPLSNPFAMLLITPQQREILHALYRADIASHEYLARVMNEWAQLEGRDDAESDIHLRVKVAICKLRQRLAHYDVKIHTIHSTGYFINADGKARLEEIISGSH